MKTYRIMTDNQKAFHRDGELSEIIKGMGDFTMITAVRVDKPAVENCGNCQFFLNDYCLETTKTVLLVDHCQLWRPND